VIYWIHTTVVRTIVTYAATVWWPRVKLYTSKAELSKLRRMICLGITGEMKTVPAAATEVIIGLLPLHLHLEAEARAGIYRLYYSNQWKPKSEGSGHAYMTQGMKKEPTRQTGTDRMIPRHVCDKPFTVRFPDRSEWEDGFQPNRKRWYTDGSKTNMGNGVGGVWLQHTAEA
jgi:hypothetical protein